MNASGSFPQLLLILAMAIGGLLLGTERTPALEIEGTVVLDGAAQWEDSELHFHAGSTLVTNGHLLFIKVGTIRVDDSAKIVSYTSPPSNVGQDGAAAAPVIVMALKLTGGTLVIDNSGQDGAHGVNGRPGEKGKKGRDAKAYEWDVLRGCRGGRKASRGGPGQDGAPGGAGGSGGDGGIIMIGVRDGRENLQTDAGGGEGGSGGEGGPGGPGGQGGRGADSRAFCSGLRSAPDGDRGSPGPQGRSGALGRPGQTIDLSLPV